MTTELCSLDCVPLSLKSPSAGQCSCGSRIRTRSRTAWRTIRMVARMPRCASPSLARAPSPPTRAWLRQRPSCSGHLRSASRASRSPIYGRSRPTSPSRPWEGRQWPRALGGATHRRSRGAKTRSPRPTGGWWTRVLWASRKRPRISAASTAQRALGTARSWLCKAGTRWASACSTAPRTLTARGARRPTPSTTPISLTCCARLTSRMAPLPAPPSTSAGRAAR